MRAAVDGEQHRVGPGPKELRIRENNPAVHRIAVGGDGLDLQIGTRWGCGAQAGPEVRQVLATVGAVRLRRQHDDLAS